MSKPREAWWPYVKNVIRLYPRIRGKPDPSNNELLYIDAVEKALKATEAKKNADERLTLINLLFFQRAIKLYGAESALYVSTQTATRWSKDFIIEVAKNLGLSYERKRQLSETEDGS